jgi:hypothetical protein
MISPTFIGTGYHEDPNEAAGSHRRASAGEVIRCDSLDLGEERPEPLDVARELALFELRERLLEIGARSLVIAARAEHKGPRFAGARELEQGLACEKEALALGEARLGGLPF